VHRSALLCSFVTFVLAGLCGCATFANKDPVVVVDSDPRGARVVDPNGPVEVLGQAPFLMRIPRGPKFTLSTTHPRNTPRSETFSCRFEWQGLLLGNLPVAASLGPALGGIYLGAAMATDILSQSTYSCPARVVLRQSSPKKNAEVASDAKPEGSCRIIAASPPYHFSRSNSDKLFLEWQQEIRPQLKACDRILPLEQVRKHLADMDITFDRPTVLGNISRAQLNHNALETGATHFADIDIVQTPEGPEMQTTLHEILGERRTKLRALRVPSLAGSVFYLPASQVLDQTFVFVPGTLAMASLFAFPQFNTDRSSYRFFSHEEDCDLKSLLANWELGYVPQPSSFSAWSVRFRSSAALSSSLVQRKMSMYWRYSNIEPEDDVFRFKDQFNLWYLGATLENRLYLFFGDYGAAFAGGSTGYVFTTAWLRDDRTSTHRPYLAGYGGYLVETGWHTFFEVQSGYATTLTPHHESRFVTLQDLVFLKIKAGLYLPRARDAVRSVW
jgi:hypothetical protein